MATTKTTPVKPLDKKAMVTIAAKTTIRHNGETYLAGDEVSLSQADAVALVALGWAEMLGELAPDTGKDAK